MKFRRACKTNQKYMYAGLFIIVGICLIFNFLNGSNNQRHTIPRPIYNWDNFYELSLRSYIRPSTQEERTADILERSLDIQPLPKQLDPALNKTYHDKADEDTPINYPSDIEKQSVSKLLVPPLNNKDGFDEPNQEIDLNTYLHKDGISDIRPSPKTNHPGVKLLDMSANNVNSFKEFRPRSRIRPTLQMRDIAGIRAIRMNSLRTYLRPPLQAGSMIDIHANDTESQPGSKLLVPSINNRNSQRIDLRPPLQHERTDVNSASHVENQFGERIPSASIGNVNALRSEFRPTFPKELPTGIHVSPMANQQLLEIALPFINKLKSLLTALDPQFGNQHTVGIRENAFYRKKSLTGIRTNAMENQQLPRVPNMENQQLPRVPNTMENPQLNIIPNTMENQQLPRVPNPLEYQQLPRVPNPLENQQVPTVPNSMENQQLPSVPNPLENQQLPRVPNPMETQQLHRVPNPLENHQLPRVPNAMENQQLHRVPNPLENQQLPSLPNPMENQQFPRVPNRMENQQLHRVPNPMENKQLYRLPNPLANQQLPRVPNPMENQQLHRVPNPMENQQLHRVPNPLENQQLPSLPNPMENQQFPRVPNRMDNQQLHIIPNIMENQQLHRVPNPLENQQLHGIPNPMEIQQLHRVPNPMEINQLHRIPNIMEIQQLSRPPNPMENQQLPKLPNTMEIELLPRPPNPMENQLFPGISMSYTSKVNSLKTGLIPQIQTESVIYNLESPLNNQQWPKIPIPLQNNANNLRINLRPPFQKASFNERRASPMETQQESNILIPSTNNANTSVKYLHILRPFKTERLAGIRTNPMVNIQEPKIQPPSTNNVNTLKTDIPSSFQMNSVTDIRASPINNVQRPTIIIHSLSNANTLRNGPSPPPQTESLTSIRASHVVHQQRHIASVPYTSNVSSIRTDLLPPLQEGSLSGKQARSKFPGMSYSCAGRRRDTGVEDLLCMEPPKFLPEYKNPCWLAGSVLRCLPYFHLIGMAKSGTTDLFQRMYLHPEIIRNNGSIRTGREGKEIWFWSLRRLIVHDEFGNHTKGMTLKEFTDLFNATEMHQATDDKGYHFKITGHGDPMDIYNRSFEDNTPQNIPGAGELLWTAPFSERHIIPNVKILIMLRDPAERLYTHYLFRALGTTREMFDDFVQKNTVALNECLRSHTLRSCCYPPNSRQYPVLMMEVPFLCTSIYTLHIKEWLRAFPREQMFIFKNEDYAKDIGGTLNRVFKFLNVSIPDDKVMKEMVSLPRAFITFAKQAAGPMLESTRTVLDDFYQPYMDELASFLQDKRFASWK